MAPLEDACSFRISRGEAQPLWRDDRDVDIEPVLDKTRRSIPLDCTSAQSQRSEVAAEEAAAAGAGGYPHTF